MSKRLPYVSDGRVDYKEYINVYSVTPEDVSDGLHFISEFKFKYFGN